MEVKTIAMADIEVNQGQIKGVPSNPRTWRRADLDLLKQSLRETPELMEARGLIVYKVAQRYVVLGGNMRYTAAKELKWKEIPCIVVPENTPAEKLKEIVIKDNSSFGRWDMDSLSGLWDNGRLRDWGIAEAWNTDPGEGDGEERGEGEDGGRVVYGQNGPAAERERVIITYPKDMQVVLEGIIKKKLEPNHIIHRVEDLG